LRASLLAAASLLTLRLLAGHAAHATPFMTTGTSVAFINVEIDEDASPRANSVLLAAGGGRLPSGADAAGTFERMSASIFTSIKAIHFSATGNDTFTSTVADGGVPTAVNFADGAGQRQTASPGGSVYVGTAPEFSLQPSSSGAASGTSASLGYNFAPTTNRSSLSPDESTAEDDADGTPGRATPDTPGAGNTAAYRAVFIPNGRFPSKFPPTGTMISQSVQARSADTMNLALRDLSTDLHGGDAHLTIEGFLITGGNLSPSSAASTSPGSTIPARGILLLPMTIGGAGSDDMSANVTILADGAPGLSGGGVSFAESLDSTFMAIMNSPPELAALAVLGAGLAGLAGLCFRRRT
jgi:hypothetical protein